MNGIAEQRVGGGRRTWPVWAGAAALLALPAVAMLFTEEVDWGPLDFAVMGVLLALVCGAWELAVRMSGDWAYRAGFALAVIAGFLLTWVNLAVGVIGDEGEPVNLVFFAVLALGVVAACVAAFRPAGMARAMALTAAAQGAVALYALTLEAWRVAAASR